MRNDEFLKLLQMVESGRRVEGRTSNAITDANVAAAEEAEGAKKSHADIDGCDCCQVGACPGCDEIHRQEIALREALHAQGIDLPAGILDPQPEP